ncbi:MAG: hypothetical protein JSW72_01710 [Candidatus Bathyarchaeota archaeon]|nr:MAG: hypothetical protein JSW72_01710 [Candidatus Bathyarchaeota archaeon]
MSRLSLHLNATRITIKNNKKRNILNENLSSGKQKTMKEYFKLGLPKEVIDAMRSKLKHLHLPADTPKATIVDKFLEDVFFHLTKTDERISVEPLDE